MDPLFNILHELGVQETCTDKLRDDGWTLDLFGMSATSIDRFDDELKEILGDV